MTYSERNKRRNFGESWWGQAWVEAIESIAISDANRLPRGRTYARLGYVGDLEVQSGVVHALVEGSDAAPYRTAVRVHALADSQWDALLDIVATKVAHAAALADGELTSELIDDAVAAGIELLPGDDEITTSCTCPDGVEMCKHAAAVCYLFADLLDDDPFSLLELRGRTQEQIAAQLRERRRTSKGAETSGEESSGSSQDTIRASLAFGQFDAHAKLPKIPRPSHHGTQMAIRLHDLPKAAGIDAYDIAALGATGAQRASDICAGVSNVGTQWSIEEDLAWRGSLCVGDESAIAALAERASANDEKLNEDARVWADAGRKGFHDVRDEWQPTEAEMAIGVAALSEFDDVAVESNMVTSLKGRVRLLRSKSGRWYRFERLGRNFIYEGIEDFEL